MSQEKAKQVLQDLLSVADVKINGNRPWDIQVHNPKFYSRVLAEQSMGWESLIWMGGGTAKISINSSINF